MKAGTASALVGFMQMAGGALLGLVIMALPLPPKMGLAVTMLCALLLTLIARGFSTRLPTTLTALA